MTETSTAVAPALNQLRVSKSWISVWVKIVHGGTPAGLSQPGSRVSDRSSCGRADAAASTSARGPWRSRARSDG